MIVGSSHPHASSVLSAYVPFGTATTRIRKMTLPPPSHTIARLARTASSEMSLSGGTGFGRVGLSAIDVTDIVSPADDGWPSPYFPPAHIARPRLPRGRKQRLDGSEQVCRQPGSDSSGRVVA